MGWGLQAAVGPGAGGSALQLLLCLCGLRSDADLGPLDALPTWRSSGKCGQRTGGVGKRRKKTTKCGLKMKAPISRRLLICAVVGIGVPFFDPKGEGLA